jgi:hypothetical protein
MTKSFPSNIRTYALAGAQARLNQLNEEQEQIHRLFPELRKGTAPRRVTGRVRSNAAPSTASPRRGRRTMSAAQRKAVGERMKQYWAARRGGTEAVGSASSEPAAQTTKAARGAAKRGRRNMSPEARKRISQAQKARWAKQRGEAKTADTSTADEAAPVAKGRRTGKRRGGRAAKRGPRKMSAAARKRISQAQKKRWAAMRKQGGTA